MDTQKILQIQMIEQESNQLNQQLQLIDQNISELQEIELSLDAIEKNENKEILSNLGKGIYLPVNVKEKKLVIEVGNKHFIKKSIPQTKEVIEEQIKKLFIGKTEIMERLNQLQEQVNTLIEQIRESQEKEKAGEKESKKEKKSNKNKKDN